MQNRVSVAEPRLPEDVQRLGITVRKASPDLMMVVHMISPDGTRDQQYISNYATLYVKDVLTRVDGVGDVNVFGARDYSMRVWLDPGKVAARGLTADDVVAALRAANLQVAAGAINQPPAMSPGAFQLSVQTLGRLTDVEQFGDIVVRADPDGTGFVRIRDIARVELGSQDYTVNAYLNNSHGDRARDLPAPGLQCADNRGRGQADDGGGEEGFPAGPRLYRRLQPDRVHPAVDRRGGAHAVRGDRAGGLRGHPVPADLARRDHSGGRHPGVAGRLLPGHGPGRHLVQHAVAVRPGAGDRHRGGRCDRGGGERRALSRARACRRATRRTRRWTRSAAR